MRRMLARVAFVALSLVALVPAPRAQQPSFTAGTRTVAVYATVTNAEGRLVPDLSREDFAIDDNGKRQELTVFSNDIQPITVVMLLDRSSSMKPNFDLEAQGAEAFVRSMGPNDKARIGSFANEIRIDPDEFSSDRDKLLRIIRQDLQEPGPTPLWNAVDRAMDKLLLEQGRRVILVTSPPHSRRVQLVWSREAAGKVEGLVALAQGDEFPEEGWWWKRRDAEAVLHEYLGLAAIYLGVSKYLN